MLLITVVAVTASLLALAGLRGRRRRADEVGAVSLEVAVISGVLVAGALVVGTLLIQKATDRANTIPTSQSPVTTSAVP